MESFTYDKKLAPKEGSKPFIAFIGEGFEVVEELKHLNQVLLDLLRGEVVDNLNLAGLDRAYVCITLSPNRVFFTHCIAAEKVRHHCAKNVISRSWPFHGSGNSSASSS